jgi:hypothetical protein
VRSQGGGRKALTPLPLVETVTKIQQIMYSKGVCQKLHAHQLCIGTLCIRALIQHSW